MQKITTDTRVRLSQDLADLELHRGEIGTIRAAWLCPATMYEVEFEHAGRPMRVLLTERQVTTASQN